MRESTKQLLREARTTHGHSKRNGKPSPEYVCWMSMRLRCSDPRTNGYARYGGRGIRVCNAWADSFEAFLREVGPRPSRRHQIDRIDNSKGYEPGNVRWATREEQGQNRRTNVNLTYDGRTQCIAVWAREMGTTSATLATRLRAGWSVERTLSTPVDRRYSRCA